MASPEYALRCELRGHDEDVRGVSVCQLGILTGSRDKTIKLWVEDARPPQEQAESRAGGGAGTAGGYSLAQTLVGHTDFVGPVMYVPPGACSDYPQGAIVSGSRDKTVRVWEPSTASCLATLAGHEYQVTCLGLLPPGLGHADGGALVSGSLDKTLRVWRGGKCAAVLSGHEGPVLCLLVLPGGEVLSGSGDTSVKMWGPGGGPCIHTIKAHADTVRGMCLVPGLGFATASHDMSVKVWDSTGGVLAELVGHTAIVYCVAAVEAPAGAGAGGSGASGGVLLASGSEDNTARLWRPNGDCLQVIEHPGNIWAVDFTPEADLLTGCSDAVARLWSADPARRGPPQLAEALASLLAERKAAREEAAAGGGDAAAAGGGGGGGGLPPGLKVEDAFVLSQPGAKEGENKFVRDPATGDIVAYSWDSKSFQWEKIGVVVAGPQGGAGPGGPAKKFWAGREWDYVFDVDVGEGLPPRKLALNREDNPYLVAQAFIEQHDLPAYFQEQIVQFILTNTGGAGKGAGAGPMPVDITGGFCDPFTGGGSGSAPPPQRPPGGGWSQPAGPLPITGGGVDPFTGGGGGGGAGGAGGLPPHPPTHVPCHTYLTFDNVPSLEALGRKIREFNATVPPPAQLNEQELAAGGALESLLQKLPKVAAAATSAASAAAPPPGQLGPADVSLLRRLLAWPPAQLFPALDLARLAALDGGRGGGAELMAAPEVAGDLAAPEPQPGTLSGALAAAAASPQPANHQLALRLAANAAAAPGPLRGWLLGGASPLLDRLAPLPAAPAAPKAVRLSGAVLLGNLAAAVGLRHLPAEAADVPLQALSAGLELLSSLPSPLEEADAAFRTLAALGTLLLAGGQELCQVAKDLDINDRIHAIVTAARGGGAAEHKLLQVGIEVTTVIARSTGVKLPGA